MPAILFPISMLDASDVQGEPQLMHLQMSMQCLAVTGQIAAGFAWLAQVEAIGLLCLSDKDVITCFACCSILAAGLPIPRVHLVCKQRWIGSD